MEFIDTAFLLTFFCHFFHKLVESKYEHVPGYKISSAVKLKIFSV